MSKTYRITALLLGVLIQGLLSDVTMAQQTGPPCGHRRDVVQRLLSDYGERPVALGLMADGNLLEVLAAPSGSWTILVTSPSRISCWTASGVAWEMERQPAGPSAHRALLADQLQ